MAQTTQFAKNLLWELLQNAGAVVGFVLAIHYFQERNWILATLLMVTGAVITAVVIAITEARKSPNHREPIKTIITNIVVMGALGLILAAVISAMSWQVSFLAGALGGFALALLQAATNLTEKHGAGQFFQARYVVPAMRHGTALAVGSGVTLLLLNLLLTLRWPVWANALVVLGVLSPIIVLIDYPANPPKSA